MEGDGAVSVQPCEHREVAELRWDGAGELIVGEVPERATPHERMRTIEYTSYSHLQNNNLKSEIFFFKKKGNYVK